MDKKDNKVKTMYENVLEQFNSVADFMKLNKNIRKILASTNSEIMVNFPVRMDNGDVKVFTGYRVQHNDILGPYKGGLRYHPTVDLEDARALSMWMTWKTSLAGIPFGGAKGGIQIDPKDYSIGELERISRRFAFALGDTIGPDKDIPAPDVNTNAQIMAWIVDTYLSTKSPSERSKNMHVVTGKPVGSGGLEGRDRATGFGVYITIRSFLQEKKQTLKGKTFVVQGFGNVGRWTAHFLAKDGAKLLAVQDATATIHNAKGIDVEKLITHTDKNKNSIKGFKGATEMETSKLFGIECDILVPAAMGNQITKYNVEQVKTKLIAEGANGPISTDAGNILAKKGIPIIPDILCNSGGVIGSYIEWLQNRNGEIWHLDEVLPRIENRISKNFKKVYDMAKEKKTTLRIAAYIIAISRIETAYLERGIFP